MSDDYSVLYVAQFLQGTIKDNPRRRHHWSLVLTSPGQYNEVIGWMVEAAGSPGSFGLESSDLVIPAKSLRYRGAVMVAAIKPDQVSRVKLLLSTVPCENHRADWKTWTCQIWVMQALEALQQRYPHALAEGFSREWLWEEARKASTPFLRSLEDYPPPHPRSEAGQAAAANESGSTGGSSMTAGTA